MKFKLLGAAACLLALIAAVCAPLFLTQEPTGRYHQHLEQAGYTPCADHDGTVFCTHLPLLQIETGGVEIPGRFVDQTATAVTAAADGSDYILCTLTVTDREQENNHLSDAPQVSTSAQINIRGRSSRFFDKVGYALRLVDERGENAPQALAGMDAHHEWVLHGPYLDKTLIRNYMWYNLAGEVMDYAPNVRFCEVVLNGDYQGVYVLTESITAGANGSRLELTVDRKDNTFSGYLLRCDSGSQTPIKNVDTFSVYSYRFPNKVNIEYPGVTNLTEEMAEAIRQDFSAFEKTLYSFDYHSDTYGYENLIDVESFVDYFILNELTLNYDAGWLSTYIYKGIDNRYRMCVWDFNSACDNYQESFQNPFSFQFQYGLWYVMLMKDPGFVNAILDRYEQLRQGVLSDEAMNEYIDETVAFLGPAVERNFTVWGYTFEEEYDMLIPAERNPRSFDEAVDDLKTALFTRADWMDRNIHTLQQYSAESKTKKFNEHTE